MAYNYDESIPEWENEGTEPSDSLKQKGYGDGNRPSADVFNYFWNRILKWISDIRVKLSALHTDCGNVETRLDTLEAQEPDMSPSTLLEKLKTLDGAGSGLDVDKLDGKHASEFSLVNHSHSEYSLSSHTHETATSTSAGFMSASDRAKLDGISAGANVYTHPATHPASMITETAEVKMMTAAERTKLAGIQAGANNYVHPSTHPASMITETDDKKIMTVAERNKLAGIEDYANVYTHPSTHPASMITGLESYMTSLGYTKVASGSYLGDGTGTYYEHSNSGTSLSYLKRNGRQVSLPFAPRTFVLVSSVSKLNILIGEEYIGKTTTVSGSTKYTIYGAVVDNVFYVSHGDDYSTNTEGTTYSWIALA